MDPTTLTTVVAETSNRPAQTAPWQALVQNRAARVSVFVAAAVALALLIYHPARHFEFLNFDDNRFVEGNPWLRVGFSWASLRWAFTAHLTAPSSYAEYWGPLTLLSRLADAQLYGINSGAFHVTSALIHLGSALVLAAALRRLTGDRLRSAGAALLFLVHPLNVEPVCWLSARKDLMSGFFFFVTLLAYAWFAEKPSLRRYAALLLAFCCALMSKPMGVTIPVILLVLDIWPLGRWRAAAGDRATIRGCPDERVRLVAEKLPLLLLAGIVAWRAVESQKSWGAIQPGSNMPFSLRIENALVAYATYVRRIFWPSDLTIYYPHPHHLGLAVVALAAIFLLAVTAAAWQLRKRAPYFLAGWLWFGIALGPVIGLVQIGDQAMADRYAYPSAVGLFVALAWGLADVTRGRPRLAAGIAVVFLGGLTAAAMHQVGFWRDSVAVFSRATAVTENNALAHLNLGTAYYSRGDLPNARANLSRSIEIQPVIPAAWLTLGSVEMQLGDDDAALRDYQKSSELDPKYVKGLLGQSRIFMKRKQNDEAVSCLQRACALDPTLKEAHQNLATLYIQQTRWLEAARVLAEYLNYHSEDQALRQLGLQCAARAAAAESAPAQ